MISFTEWTTKTTAWSPGYTSASMQHWTPWDPLQPNFHPLVHQPKGSHGRKLNKEESKKRKTWNQKNSPLSLFTAFSFVIALEILHMGRLAVSRSYFGNMGGQISEAANKVRFQMNKNGQKCNTEQKHRCRWWGCMNCLTMTIFSELHQSTPQQPNRKGL